MIDPGFWRGRRVFVTGHTGFMGGWLVLLLNRLGAEVHGYALEPPTTPSLFDAARVGEALATDTRADIGAAERLAAAVAAAQPEILLHLAAQPLVLDSYRDPVATYAVNIMGTVHVMEALRSAAVRAAVIVTSDKCYRNESGGPFVEEDALGGADPYSSSKACAELVTAAYRSSFFSGDGSGLLATARAGNVIGGGDWAANRLIPDCVRAVKAGVPVRLRHPGAIRPWQHVLDAVAGYLALIQKLCGDDGRDYAAAWNFGPDARSVPTVGAVADEIMARLGGTVVADERPDAPPEAAVLQLDSHKAARDLGWTQKLPAIAALAETAAWYSSWVAGADMAAVTRAQIERHLR